MLAHKRNKIMNKKIFSNFFISNWTLAPPTHFQSLFGFFFKNLHGPLLLLRPIPYLGSAHRVFNLHVLRTCTSSVNTNFSIMYFLLITSLHLSLGLPVCRCPPISIFHVIITTSSSIFLSTCPYHISLASLIFSCMFATPAHGLINFLHF